MNDEHDITKKMLNTIRENVNVNKMLLNENDEPQGTSADGAIQPNPNDLKDEQKKFMQIVGPRVEFKSFNIYPNDNNVVLAGEFDNGLSWQFSKRDGLYINANSLKLDAETVETLKKLSAYYNNWADEWSQKLQQEYKRTS